MTSCERVTAVFAHREPDRTPIFEYVLLSPLADRLLGRTTAESNWAAVVKERGWEKALLQHATDRLDLAELLEHDLLYIYPLAVPQPEKAQPEKPAEAISDDPVERVRRRNRRAAELTPSVSAEQARQYTLLKEEMARRGLDLPVLAPAYVHGIWTDTDLMETMALEPEVAHEHFRQATRRILPAVDFYLSMKITMIGVGGDFAGNRPLISPEAYRRFILPEVRALSRRIHAGGGYAVNASDGNLWPVISDFLLGCEVDGYNEIDLHAGMDLARLKKEYGARITLFGNMDCGNVLSFWPPEEVRRATRQCLAAGWGNGGHIFSASNAITGSVPFENYMAMVGAYRNYFGLPPLSVEK